MAKGFDETWLAERHAKRGTATPAQWRQDAPAKVRKPRNNEEQREQMALIRWRDTVKGIFPALRWLVAIPNGGHRGKAAAGKAKAEGATAGVPDLILLHPSPHGYPGLLIEMKSRIGKLSAEQREFLLTHESQGYCTAVCRSAKQAQDVLLWYLGMSPEEPVERRLHIG